MPLRVLQFVFAFHFVAGGELGAGALGTEARSLILPPAKAPLVLSSMIENGPLYPREPRYNPAYTKLPRYRLKQTREIRAMVCRHRRDNWPFFQQ